jgi:hypothetical protein
MLGFSSSFDGLAFVCILTSRVSAPSFVGMAPSILGESTGALFDDGRDAVWSSLSMLDGDEDLPPMV